MPQVTFLETVGYEDRVFYKGETHDLDEKTASALGSSVERAEGETQVNDIDAQDNPADRGAVDEGQAPAQDAEVQPEVAPETQPEVNEEAEAQPEDGSSVEPEEKDAEAPENKMVDHAPRKK